MILLDCPNCGRRSVQEYRYGGEYNPRPSDAMETSDLEWADYIYMRDNKSGVQKEWWYHNSGCGLWFLAERDTRTNEVMKIYRWQPSNASQRK